MIVEMPRHRATEARRLRALIMQQIARHAIFDRPRGAA
jgi:hypothetical protein